jgi:hypothetical protein
VCVCTVKCRSVLYELPISADLETMLMDKLATCGDAELHDELVLYHLYRSRLGQACIIDDNMPAHAMVM